MDPVNSLDSLNSLNSRESSKFYEFTGFSESTDSSESSEFVQNPGIWGTIGKVQRGALLARRPRFQSSVRRHVDNGSNYIGVSARTAILSREITLKNKWRRLGQGARNWKRACGNSGGASGKAAKSYGGRKIALDVLAPEGG